MNFPPQTRMCWFCCMTSSRMFQGRISR
jgi:hypothetical protein